MSVLAQGESVASCVVVWSFPPVVGMKKQGGLFGGGRPDVSYCAPSCETCLVKLSQAKGASILSKNLSDM